MKKVFSLLSIVALTVLPNVLTYGGCAESLPGALSGCLTATRLNIITSSDAGNFYIKGNASLRYDDEVQSCVDTYYGNVLSSACENAPMIVFIEQDNMGKRTK